MVSSAIFWTSMSSEVTISLPFLAFFTTWELPPAIGVPPEPVSTIILPSVPSSTSL